jgi:hypothetical protein
MPYRVLPLVDAAVGMACGRNGKIGLRALCLLRYLAYHSTITAAGNRVRARAESLCSSSSSRHIVDLPLSPRKFLCQPRADAREDLFRRSFWR